MLKQTYVMLEPSGKRREFPVKRTRTAQDLLYGDLFPKWLTVCLPSMKQPNFKPHASSLHEEARSQTGKNLSLPTDDTGAQDLHTVV